MTYEFTNLSDTEKLKLCGNKPEKHRQFGSDMRNEIIKGYYNAKKQGIAVPWNLNQLIFLCESVWNLEPLTFIDGKGNRHMILLDLNLKLKRDVWKLESSTFIDDNGDKHMVLLEQNLKLKRSV